MCSEVRGLA
ncbi:uncharacterized protein CELE_F55A4.13 [Caenorhabditis elegans]|uniref:Uncharacterized protein n=1 Tax=Caenorhabditis elegans TaxID=6239 RepID=A0A2K5AU09_CAEEL|nr:Uncharacterized protein CELE_F55A4.13 [Caenorhabditis elegans]SPC48670.1 Uncharacterized protein CELE_F55A4.13 [Caenorhabditis elegans]|eukprot:NP_001348809.1 Uncharacterized protein CELE_F55A4.13 [Caenorhabditis elegans]